MVLKRKTSQLLFWYMVAPYARDDASWDYWAQFLASRGYAVLKPNFRGSDGYGDAYMKAGYNQWGGLMQRDVADATRYLIDNGIADKDRICIAGASYGGYAAMMGLIQDPRPLSVWHHGQWRSEPEPTEAGG